MTSQNKNLHVAIVHYHLKPGGVTRVIESTLRGLRQADNIAECTILTGQLPETFEPSDNVVEVKGLCFSNEIGESLPLSLDDLKRAATEATGSLPDVWHIHNHSIGKNQALIEIVSQLSEEGSAVLLQIHDFPEDGRPDNYKSLRTPQRLYPKTPRVHYASINSRDYRFLRQMGVDKKQLHLLPNPVECDALVEEIAEIPPILETLDAKRLFLYPVRAVRRKNIGEMLLWSALSNDGDVFATTLEPACQDDVPAYERWKQFSNELNLPVHFEVGTKYNWPFRSLMNCATAIMTTSIAEGFGLAYLEPWLFGKQVVGRNLPAITADFKSRGLNIDAMYNRLDIPVAWLNQTDLSGRIEKELKKSYRSYQVPLPSKATSRALNSITNRNGRIDFGGLDEHLQETIIAKVVRDPASGDLLKQNLNILEFDSDNIENNAYVVEKEYNLGKYTSKLSKIYQNLFETLPGPVDFFDSKQILDIFLRPENFRLLRT